MFTPLLNKINKVYFEQKIFNTPKLSYLQSYQLIMAKKASSSEPTKTVEPGNHLWVKTEEDALKIIKSPNSFVYYVIRYWSPNCEGCIQTNPAFMSIAQTYSDIAFFSVEAKSIERAKYFSQLRGTPSFAIGSKYAGQIAFIEGTDLLGLAKLLSQL